MLALWAAVVWWLTLGLLALLTANPVTLNYMQIRQADYVVTAKVVDLDIGSVDIQEEWKQDVTLDRILDRIKVENLHEVEAATDSTYLIPISRLDRDRFIAVTRLREVVVGGGIVRHNGHVVDGVATAIELSRDTGLPEKVRKKSGDDILAGSKIEDGRITIEFDISARPCIYPATAEAVEQLQHILDDLAAAH